MTRTAPRKPRSARVRTDDYGVLLVSIVVTIIVAAALGRSPWGRWFAAVMQGITLLLTLRIAGAATRARFVTLLLVVVGILAAAGSIAVGDADMSRAIAGAISALLVVGAPVAIVRGVIGHVEVTARTVLAALSIYLLIGLFFTFAYSVMAAIDSAPFFVSGFDGVLPEQVYFSFSTLTTVGFGDLTARGDLGRMAAVLEALIGQIYLVTVVALLVGNLTGRRREGMRRED